MAELVRGSLDVAAAGGGALAIDAIPPKAHSDFPLGVNSLHVSSDGLVMSLRESKISGLSEVLIYDLVGGAWTERAGAAGPIPSGSNFAMEFGHAMTADGLRILVTDDGYDGAQFNEGRVYVYSWTGAVWSLVQDFGVAGAVQNYQLGQGFAVSGDGDVAIANSGTAEDTIRVWDWNGSAYVIRTEEISTPSGGDVWGRWGMCCNDDGSVAAGIYYNSGYRVAVMAWSGSAWAIRGGEIVMPTASNIISNVSLNAAGTVLWVVEDTDVTAVEYWELWAYDWVDPNWVRRASAEAVFGEVAYRCPAAVRESPYEVVMYGTRPDLADDPYVTTWAAGPGGKNCIMKLLSGANVQQVVIGTYCLPYVAPPKLSPAPPIGVPRPPYSPSGFQTQPQNPHCADATYFQIYAVSAQGANNNPEYQSWLIANGLPLNFNSGACP